MPRAIRKTNLAPVKVFSSGVGGRTQGFALVIVMVLLAALASVGVATFRSALLELRLVSVLTHKQALHVRAESTVNCVMASAQKEADLNLTVSDIAPEFQEACGLAAGGMPRLGVTTESATSNSTAFDSITTESIDVVAHTHFCQQGMPSANIATDASVMQAHHFATTATASRNSDSSTSVVQQHWLVHQPKDPTFLPTMADLSSSQTCSEYAVLP